MSKHNIVSMGTQQQLIVDAKLQWWSSKCKSTVKSTFSIFQFNVQIHYTSLNGEF